MAHMVVPGERFAFDRDVWAEEVGRFAARGQAHRSAEKARTEIERHDARIAAQPCRSDGPDRTRLAGCAKVYVPLAAGSCLPGAIARAIGSRASRVSLYR